ncbi:hypothetical protein Clacol_006005 [Clathrus columnatus]|uniref:Cyclase n=1 Tax=Clathrus columnatus TaxID=1419009 RepID=A0AAV5ADI8_9AGAM|nr:hypothetical protein Clacol_006005 [Clathrus columnatus]
MPYDNLPNFNELPSFADLPGCAWGVWGEGDELGTVNLLTDEVVAHAAKEEIRPIGFPSKPMFNRKLPEHRLVSNTPVPRPAANDDELHINTQSGTQWDGLRHFGIFSAKCFYQGVKADSIEKGPLNITDPSNIPRDKIKLGIHRMCGRGVLIDLVKYFTENGKKPLPYDPWTTHGISVQDIQEAAKQQGVSFRQADILILRKYNNESQENRDNLRGRQETFTGIEQSLEMKEFLWNNHFAAIASDQPSLESWPVRPGDIHLHQTILGLWGMPIGEFFDLEALAKYANETGRYTFFFSSWPLNVLGGVASPPNAAAIF